MKIYGITYSDERMITSARVCLESMQQHGVDHTRGYNSDWWKAWEHSDTFDWLNKDVLSTKRGGGYWLWKSWCVAQMMTKIDDGDILIYSDAGVKWVNRVHHIIDVMDQDIFFFTNGFPHVEWCKADCIDAIIPGHMIQLGAKREVNLLAKHLKQVQASVIFIKVNQNTRNFVKEWLLWCQMPGFIDDSPSKLPNYPTFAEHRHDQAILTCLQIKYGYKLHWWPTAYAEHIRVAGDNYPVMFDHHRKRNTGMGEGQPEW